MSRTAWTFADTPDVKLEVNPSTDKGSLDVTKEVGYSVTAGPDGKTLMYVKGMTMPRVAFSGFIYSESQYNTLIAEVDKDLSVLTDDRGVVFDIVWSEFSMTRVRSAKYPWKHEYSITGLVKSYVLPA